VPRSRDQHFDPLKESLLFKKGKYLRNVTDSFKRSIAAHKRLWSACLRENSKNVGVIVLGQSELFEVIGALHPPCGFPGCLNGGQQQGDQHADNGNDDKKFNERKSTLSL